MIGGKIVLEGAERQELERRMRASTIAVRDRQRAEIVVLRADGLKQEQIAARLGVSRVTVNDWCQRFLAQRLAGLDDAPGRGRKPSLPPEAVRMVLEKAVTPPATLARWSCRTMAREAGISQASVQRLWAANAIKRHLWRTFKLSKDTQFEAKFWDVIGLYLDPPEKALVLCCDEKSQCQALQRTQPGLPLGVGHIRTRTHDYIRHGTLTLFAALNYLDGQTDQPDRQASPTPGVARLPEDHRPRSSRRSDPSSDRRQLRHTQACQGQSVAGKHPRFHMHFTPTSSSWLNLVERFFRDLTDFITEKSFASLAELSDAIIGFLAERNANARRYVWHAKGEEILRKITVAREKLAVTRIG